MTKAKAKPPKDARHVENFTTGQVARICGVASRTVSVWCDSGRLPCWRIPGGVDRRIRRVDLVGFMKLHGIAFTSDSLFAFPNGVINERCTSKV